MISIEVVMNSHPVMYKTTDLRSDVLDKVWRDWNWSLNTRHTFETSYKNVIRLSSRAKAFENWLDEQGAYIVQKNQKRFIRFHNDEQAFMFTLRWL